MSDPLASVSDRVKSMPCAGTSENKPDNRGTRPAIYDERCKNKAVGGRDKPGYNTRGDAEAVIDCGAWPNFTVFSMSILSNAGIIFRSAWTHFIDHRSRTSRPTPEMENSMRSLFLAAFAALTLSAAVVPAANAHSSVAGDASATRMQQTESLSGGG